MDESPFAAAWSVDGSRLALSGAVDELAQVDLYAELLRGVPGVAVTVDLSEVQYLPSVAVSTIVRAQQAAAYPLTLAARRGCIAERVLEISGIPHMQL